METTLDAATPKDVAKAQLDATTPATAAPPTSTDGGLFIVHSKALYDDPSNMTTTTTPEFPVHPVTLQAVTQDQILDHPGYHGGQYQECVATVDHQEVAVDPPRDVDQVNTDQGMERPDGTSQADTINMVVPPSTFADRTLSTITQPQSHLSDIADAGTSTVTTSNLDSATTQPEISGSGQEGVTAINSTSETKFDETDGTGTQQEQRESESVSPMITTTTPTDSSPLLSMTPASEVSELSSAHLHVVSGTQLQSPPDTQAVMDAAVVQVHDDNSFSVPTEPEDDATSRTMLRMGISSTIVEAPSTPQHTELPEGEILEDGKDEEEPLSTPTRNSLCIVSTADQDIAQQSEESPVASPESGTGQPESTTIEVSQEKEDEHGDTEVQPLIAPTPPAEEDASVKAVEVQPDAADETLGAEASVDAKNDMSMVETTAEARPDETTTEGEAEVTAPTVVPMTREHLPSSETPEASRIETTSEVEATKEVKQDTDQTAEQLSSVEPANETTITSEVGGTPTEETTSPAPESAPMGATLNTSTATSEVESPLPTPATTESSTKLEYGVAGPPTVSDPLQPVVCTLMSLAPGKVDEQMPETEAAAAQPEIQMSANEVEAVPSQVDIPVEETEPAAEATDDQPITTGAKADGVTPPEIVLSPASGLGRKVDDEVATGPSSEMSTPPLLVKDHMGLRGRFDFESVMKPGAGEDPMVMVVPIAPGRLEEEGSVVKVHKSQAAETTEAAKVAFKKKREASVFTSKPAESNADASALRAIEVVENKPAVFASKPQVAQVTASAFKPCISPRTPQTVFVSKASKSFADASALTPASPRAQEKAVYESSASPSQADVSSASLSTSISPEKTVFESEARPSYSDAGAYSPAPLSARAQRALYESHASPSMADATATSPHVMVQKKSVFVSEAGPSVASVRHSDETPVPRTLGVYESKGLPSTAHARANEDGTKLAEPVMAFVSHPMPSIADVKSTDPPKVLTRGASGMFVNEPEPSRSEAKWDASAAVKQEKTIFESTPKVERAADVTWKDPASTNPGPPVFVNVPAPSMADTSALRDVEIEEEEATAEEIQDEV